MRGATLIMFILMVAIMVMSRPKRETFCGTCRVSIVVARYMEDLSWLEELPVPPAHVVVDLVVYNKGSQFRTEDIVIPNYIQNVKIVYLPNVGRCDHTYVYHIVNNYGRLADVTVFLTGSARIPRKWGQTLHTISTVYATCNTAFAAVDVGDVRNTHIGFTIESWQATAQENKSRDTSTVKSSIRPYEKWYDHHFDYGVSHICYAGIFAVHARHIRQRSSDAYAEILNELSAGDNVEVGHFVERSWFAIFHPVDAACII